MISLKETTFDFDAISNQIIGAGILPISIDGRGTIRLLLGKERYINHWRGSLKWSGFEGGRKPGEDIEKTAAREFIEESMGIVKFDNEHPTVERITKFLLDDRYVARIVLCIVHGEQQERRYHVTYLVEVEYNEEYQMEFVNRRRTFVELQQKANQLSKLGDQIVDMHLPCENEYYHDIKVRDILRAESITPETLCIDFVDESGKFHTVQKKTESEWTSVYMKWFHIKKTFADDTKEFSVGCREAITMNLNDADILRTVKVNEDYIEKQTIQWWSLKDLKTVIKNGGYANSEFFRAYFLPVLQRSIEEIESITNFFGTTAED